jgi:hypothetical protein
MILNRFFKHIDLPGWEKVAETVLEWTNKNTDFCTNKRYRGWTSIDTRKMIFEVPELGQLFESAGFKITNISFFLRNDLIPSPPHSHVGDDLARINIPILNCKGTFTKFYKSSAVDNLVDNPQGMPLYQLSSFNEAMEIASCEISVPTVLSVKTLHAVIVPLKAPLPRIMISVKVDPDPIYLLIKD